jgi:hypothetical protein
MLIREVHLSAEQFKETCRAYIDAGRGIAFHALLAIETNMRCFIDLEAD